MTEFQRLEVERDILRELLVDEIQNNRLVSREKAIDMVSREVFEQMRRKAS